MCGGGGAGLGKGRIKAVVRRLGCGRIYNIYVYFRILFSFSAVQLWYANIAVIMYALRYKITPRSGLQG